MTLAAQERQIDPFTFEVIRHRLNQVMEEGIDALKNVSGSATTNEGHDMMLSLYTGDGHLMLGGVGFLHHLTSAGQAVKHILASYHEDPGIREGDVYMLNDSYTAALHSSDIYLVSPIYYEGRLRCFVSNFVHATDIGAVDPGGFAPTARECYQEGFATKGLKIVEGGRIRRDVVETYLNMVREPGLVALDMKSQLAANYAAGRQLCAMFAEYGAETVDTVARLLIEQSNNLFRRRLRELPDGIWRVKQYVDWYDSTNRIELAVTKQGEILTFDFTGTDAQSTVGVNNSYWATWGALFAPIYPLLAWDMTWNEGLMDQVRLVAPEGTLVNCTRPAPVSLATVTMIKVVNDMASLLIGRILAASHKYNRRAMAVWDGCHSAIHWTGTDAEGRSFLSYSTDAFAGAGGAKADRDGVDLGGEIPNGVSRWANVETQEWNAPILYLYRRAVTDSGGPGKYRGGVTHEWAIGPLETAASSIELVVTTTGLKTPLSIGICGGYPGCTTGSAVVRNADLERMPDRLAATVGQHETATWGKYWLGDRDLFYHRFQGGGGYGDPLDRSVSAVADDVARDLVSMEAATEIYGVVLTGDCVPDIDGTARRRREAREARIERSVPIGLVERSHVAPTGRRIGEYLQAVDSRTQCTWCGDVFSSSGNHWKYDAVCRDTPLTAAGLPRDGSDEIVMRQFFCPTCATVLQVDIALGPDSIVTDEIWAWPQIEEEVMCGQSTSELHTQQ
jgi:N-methylhydantoinase B